MALNHAAARGTTVVCAGGNSRPGYGTIVNVAPWVITVAASTMDRSFPTKIILENGQFFKPDTAAPGVDILAVDIPSALGLRTVYSFRSGTSMATPHVAGIVALLKVVCPACSPAAIRSAIVTPAWTADPYSRETIFEKGDIPKGADPFDYGYGVINPNGAGDIPGLIYDIGTQDYINYLCPSETSIDQLTGEHNTCPTTPISILDLNLPSITVPNLSGTITITRTIINAGDPSSTYNVAVYPPLGISVTVNPTTLSFSSTITRMSFTVTLTTRHRITTEYYFGSLTWTNGVNQVRIPTSVKTEIPQT